MLPRRMMILMVLLMTLLGSAELPQARADDTPPLGRKLADFPITDTTTFSQQVRGKKASVLLFLSTRCPVSVAYVPRIQQLSKRYAEEVAFVGVFSHPADDATDVRQFGEQFALGFPLVTDEGTRIADQLAIERVPTVVLLDATRAVRYIGRIDDQFSPQVQRPQASTRELANAIESLLEGQPIKVPHTVASGCIITREKKSPPAEATVTYAQHVLPILQAKCQDCHRPGEAAPFSLLTYKSAKSWSGMIREVVADNIMPPWHVDAPHGHFRNDRRLTDTEKATLLSWIDAGCPEGDMSQAPAAREFVPGWRLPRKPDLELKMERSVSIPAHTFLGMGLPYYYVKVGEPFPEDTWIEAVEVRPEYRAVVHHIICFILPPGEGLEALKGGDFGAYMLGAYVPGDAPIVLPPGYARKVPKGSQLLFEMHYTPNGQAGRDQSMIGLCIRRTPPRYEVLNKAVYNPRFRIPPGADNHMVQASHTFEKATTIFSLAPHMHVRGKAFRYEIIKPTGEREVILNMPKYDFNWQLNYEFAQPITVPAGTQLLCTAWYDNSTKNPANPDPRATVRWGNQTWEEMMIGFVTYTEDQ